MEEIPDAVSPLGQGSFEREPVFDDDASSVYSPQQTARPSPLRLSHVRSQSKFNGAGEGSFQEWKRSHDSSMIRESVSHPEDLVNRPRRSKSSADGLRQARAIAVHSPPIPQVVTVSFNNSSYHRTVQDTPVFSPLQFYFRGTDYPSSKKGEKTMIGDNGWLERPNGGSDQSSKTPQKKTGILDNIKKLAKDMVCWGNTASDVCTNLTADGASSYLSSGPARNPVSPDITGRHLTKCQRAKSHLLRTGVQP